MHTSKKIGVAQIGSKHGHAISVLSTIINNPRVNFIGLYEPDLKRRNELKNLWKCSREFWFSNPFIWMQTDAVKWSTINYNKVFELLNITS